MSDDAPVLRLVTSPERQAAEEAEYVEGASSEAIQILERALELLRSRPVGSRAVSCVVAFAFEDGAYGSIVPVAGDKLGHLIGATSDALYRLHKSTNGDT